jgi:hypothetical protein
MKNVLENIALFYQLKNVFYLGACLSSDYFFNQSYFYYNPCWENNSNLIMAYIDRYLKHSYRYYLFFISISTQTN